MNPGNIAIAGDLLIATSEGPEGLVYVYRIDRTTGNLTEVNRVDTMAVNPSYITIDSSRRYVIVTHFSVGAPVRKVRKNGDGSFSGETISNDAATCLYRLDPEKGLGELLDVGFHEVNHGPMTMIHKACESPDHTFFSENDLGQNKVHFFRIVDGKLHYFAKADIAVGDIGPRHGAFHPAKPYLYINYEHKGKVSKLDFSDWNDIRITEELNLLKPDEQLEPGDNQSELMFHPNGMILYNFLRGKGKAYVISVDGENGSMRILQELTLPGNDPRGAFYSPDKRFILIEGHNTEEVYTLKVEDDGTLFYTGQACAMAHPACIAFCL